MSNLYLNTDRYITPLETAKLLNVTTTTLINWDREGKIECIRTKGGHKRFLLSYILREFGITSPENTKQTKRRICYCRVSTASQKKDLETQIQFFKLNYPEYEVISDVGSGINFKRKGLLSILDSSVRGDIEEVVVTNKDRLCRFGFELIERVIQSSNGKIVVLDREETTTEKEFVDDILSIITVFSSRLYGTGDQLSRKRSHSLKKQIRDKIKLENSEDQTVSN